MTHPRKALVVKLSSLGDLFHALPAVHLLKEKLGCSIDWLTQPEYRELVSCFTDVNRVLEYPRRAFFSSLPAFLKALRAERYDWVFDFQGLFKSALCARLARAEQRIGPSFAREGAAFFYTARAGQLNRQRHAVEEALDLARYMDATSGDVRFPVQFPERSLEGPRPHVAMLPCSRWLTKNWPPSHFARLATLLQKEVGGTLFLFGSAADRERCAAIEREAGVPMRNLCGQTSLVEMGGMLGGMDLMITVDSGPMHMAAALGVPVLALFGATDPARTGPYGPGHVVAIKEGLDCRPCRSRVCLRQDRELACLRELEPGRVLALALARLAASR